MNKVLKKELQRLIGIILAVPVILILFVRFTDTAVSDGDHFIPGNDEVYEMIHSFEKEDYALSGIDGPYVIGDTMIRVNDQNEILKKELQSETIHVRVNNPTKDSFNVSLRNDFESPAGEYPLPDKMISISDIEGNFDGFSGFLQKNQVIDDHFDWIYGDGHLVLLGDFVDRGDNVIPTLWLIYKLEQEAEESGGKVHFILGNHEVMNIQGDFSYARDRYKKIASEIGGFDEADKNYRVLYSEESHLGRWLRSKNVVEKIGDYLFVHGGLSPLVLPLRLSLNEMNTIARENIDFDPYYHPTMDHKAVFIMGIHGPFWYRGLVVDYLYYDKIFNWQLKRILKRYDSKHIVIGHTVVQDISTDFDGKVIRLDVRHGDKKYSGGTKGLLVENELEYRVNDLGKKVEL